MVSYSMGFHSWKHPKKGKNNGAPEDEDEDEATEYKGHVLFAKWGIFNERLVWECRLCGKERRLKINYMKPCSAKEE